MCGIAGQLNLSRSYSRFEGSESSKDRATREVTSMCDLMGHRGPDDHSVWTDGTVSLGHRRLSIIDLSTKGRNPMSNEDDTVWGIFNGEIYNFQTIKKDLLEKGHRFK